MQSHFENRIALTLDTLSSTFIPTSTTTPPKTKEFLTIVNKHIPTDLLLQIKIVLYLMTTHLGSFLLFLTIQPFHLQSRQEREQSMNRWKLSRLSLFRGLFKAIKNLIGISHYGSGDPTILKNLSYDLPTTSNRSTDTGPQFENNNLKSTYECDVVI